MTKEQKKWLYIIRAVLILKSEDKIVKKLDKIFPFLKKYPPTNPRLICSSK